MKFSWSTLSFFFLNGALDDQTKKNLKNDIKNYTKLPFKILYLAAVLIGFLEISKKYKYA